MAAVHGVLALSFVNPGLLTGLALAGLPILIHILNRRRFKVMEWAAMDFLLKAAVRNRRRVRLENLLLLALRTLLVLLLIAIVARPFTRREDSLAALFGSEGAVERIILLDDSHSMNAGQGNRSAFKGAKQVARRLVERLHEQQSGDRITLVRGTRPLAGDEDVSRVAIASANVKNSLVRRLEQLRVSDGSLDVARALDSVRRVFRDRENERVVLHLVSDFRRRDWAEPDGSLRPDALRALERFSNFGAVRLVDVGGPRVQNIAVTNVAPAERAVVAGVPSTFVATVRNHGPDPAANVSVEFRFGDIAELPVKLEGTLPPGEEAQVKREFTFRTAGPAVVSARIATDVVPGDDVRRRVVNVRRSMRFLLVDGEPDPEPYRSETDFLAAALMPKGRVASGVEVEVCSEHAFRNRPLDSYDGVFLCNVYRVPDKRVAELEEYVAKGGGLVFFLGDQVDPQVYNATLFGHGENVGRGLLPVLLRDVEGAGEGYVNLTDPDTDHPVCAFLRGMNRIIFRTVSVSRWISAEAPPSDTDVRVLLKLGDNAGSPALVEKAFGLGRVLLWTTAADDEWSNFPKSPLYLMLALECARYVVRPDPAAQTITVGEPIEVPYDPRRMAPRVTLRPPDSLGGGSVAVRSFKDEKTQQLTYRYDATHAAGVYELGLRTPEGEERTHPYAVNVDPTEGRLAHLDAGRLAAAVPGLRVERAADAAALATDDSDRTEFWRTLVYALIAVAALETLLAWRFGHHKTTTGPAESKQVFVR